MSRLLADLIAGSVLKADLRTEGLRQGGSARSKVALLKCSRKPGGGPHLVASWQLAQIVHLSTGPTQKQREALFEKPELRGFASL